MSTYVSVKNRGEVSEEILMCLAHVRQRGKVIMPVLEVEAGFHKKL